MVTAKHRKRTTAARPSGRTLVMGAAVAGGALAAAVGSPHDGYGLQPYPQPVSTRTSMLAAAIGSDPAPTPLLSATQAIAASGPNGGVSAGGAGPLSDADPGLRVFGPSPVLSTEPVIQAFAPSTVTPHMLGSSAGNNPRSSATLGAG